MGASGSKIEEDKALALCRERKRFVRQALDGRCSLAAAHVAYIQSLRNTGAALRKFVNPDATLNPSAYASASGTLEPAAFVDKPISQFSYSPPTFHQHVERTEQLSPTPSPPSSGRFHANYMKAGKTAATTIKDKPPIPITATLQTSGTPKQIILPSDDLSLEPPSIPPGTPPWDYFDIFHPIDTQLSFQDGRSLHRELDDAHDIKRLREEEGIPELEEVAENSSTDGKDNVRDSEDDFDQPSNVKLVRMFKNQNKTSNKHLTNGPSTVPSVEAIASDADQLPNVEKNTLTNGTYENSETPITTPTTSKTRTPAAGLLLDGKVKENGSGCRPEVKDFISCMKIVEDLFLRAAESGREVPRMLEANKVNFRPLFPEETARKSKASILFNSCFSCCIEDVQLPADPPPNEMKYLTWHRSMSSLSSSSRIPLSVSQGSNEDLYDNAFSGVFMNSGSHASTLDRLYAWERKLYDEVKASGIIRREYDMKCRLLRHEESKGESHYKIDKTRAAVKDLHARIRVAIHRIDSISKSIEDIRDKELQPQLEELIGSLCRMWTTMLHCHKHQFDVVSMTINNGSAKVIVRRDLHQQATTLLEFELTAFCSSFTKWISSHKCYLQAINSWLRKCVLPLKPKSSRRGKVEEFDPKRDRAPPLFVTCKDWLLLLDSLPTKDVEDAINDLAAVASNFLPQEKSHGDSKVSFSLLGKSGVGVDNAVNDAHPNITLDLHTLQSSLSVFLDLLQAFAEKSVEKYLALQKAIEQARDFYNSA